MSYYFRNKSLKGKKRERTRSALIDSVISEIATNGFNNLSIKEVAHAAGLANGTFYNHFDNLDELIKQSVAAVAKEIVEDIAISIADISDGLERMIVSTEKVIRLLVAEPDWGIILVGAWNNFPEHRDDVSRFLRADLRKAKSQKSVPAKVTPLLENQIISVILLGVVTLIRDGDQDVIRLETHEAVLKLLGIGPKPAAELVKTVLAKHG